MFDALKIFALSFIISGCVALPKPPDTPLCMYDNYSTDKKSGREYSKNPAFHCVAANGTEFEIDWNSPSAKNVVGTPHDDWVRLNAYYKKIFDIFEREFLNKAGKK